MKTVSVITGGGSGMGLATAKMSGKEHYIIIAGRNLNKLEKAVEELRRENIEGEFLVCDISNRDSVKSLAKRAREIGVIHTVIHAAGMSPNTGEIEKDSMEKYTRRSIIKRSGRVEEIAGLFAFRISSKASYLTGIDILCDGGCIASGVTPLIRN
jgi:NAD(P)-dependent dehydrogenase (short-subunit alcohol dehydrogenase family)